MAGRPKAVDGIRAVLDWDVAGPDEPICDVAFAAWNFVPLLDAAKPVQQTAARVRLLVEEYGEVLGAGLATAPVEAGLRVPTAVEVLARVVPEMTARGRTDRPRGRARRPRDAPAGPGPPSPLPDRRRPGRRAPPTHPGCGAAGSGIGWSRAGRPVVELPTR